MYGNPSPPPGPPYNDPDDVARSLLFVVAVVLASALFGGYALAAIPLGV